MKALEWEPGYSQAALDAAQERFGLVFPPDLIVLLREHRPRGWYDWASDEEAIRFRLSWPLEGILFDVEQNGLWWPEWGDRPPNESERAEVVTAAVSAAPKLIPLFGHRFIPEEPAEEGNPIFSVHQSDIIVYGTNLENYLENEFSGPHSFHLADEPKRIRFWSDAVDRAWDSAYRPPLPE